MFAAIGRDRGTIALGQMLVSAPMNTESSRIRLDKWLWAARLFKTRSLAAEQIGKGHVHVNDQPAKASREVHVGDFVALSHGQMPLRIVVKGLSQNRGPAPVAALLYQETEDSIEKRQQAAEQRRLAPEPALSLNQGRPTKRDRRDTDQLRQHDWDERWSARLKP